MSQLTQGCSTAEGPCFGPRLTASRHAKAAVYSQCLNKIHRCHAATGACHRHSCGAQYRANGASGRSGHAGLQDKSRMLSTNFRTYLSKNGASILAQQSQYRHPVSTTSPSTPQGSLYALPSQGLRSSFEDSHVVDQRLGICGVFDGHLGDQAAAFCAERSWPAADHSLHDLADPLRSLVFWGLVSLQEPLESGTRQRIRM